MSNDAEVTVSPPGDPDPIKTETYLLRGETVSIGGTLEWILQNLARRFSKSESTKPSRLWDDLKSYITASGLNPELQSEIRAVSEYFRPRALAAHASLAFAAIGSSIQIWRLFENDGPQLESVTLDQLRAERSLARDGYSAMQAIGRTLDAHAPEVLGDLNVFLRSMLLDTL